MYYVCQVFFQDFYVYMWRNILKTDQGGIETKNALYWRWLYSSSSYVFCKNGIK